MAAETVLRKVGNSSGITIPKAVCEDAGFDLGASLLLEVSPGVITVTAKPSDVSRRIGAAAGKKLVTEEWYSSELDAEIAALFEDAL